MNDIYWYISKDKLEALQKYNKSRVNWLKELSFTVKSPFAEANTAIRLDQTLFKQTEQIEQKLYEDGLVKDYTKINEASVFFSFDGYAQRAIEQGAYWIAMLSSETALLLAGSVTNVIGGPTTNTREISPSVDPLGAISSAFQGNEELYENWALAERCSYLWQAIARPVRQSWTNLPYVEGIGIYAGNFTASKAQMNRAGFKGIVSIVVGSPIFVRQY
jgi:hypothetical protein